MSDNEIGELRKRLEAQERRLAVLERLVRASGAAMSLAGIADPDEVDDERVDR